MDMNLSGAITALITPFAQGHLDETRLREQIEFQIEGGIDGVVPAGTTGESPTLSFMEHERLIQLTVQVVAGRVPVIAGTGANSTAEAMDLHRFAKDAGADACLSVNPYYNKPSQEGLYRHFATLADAVELPIVLYNIPGRTGVNMTPQTVARLAAHSNIVAIKEASANLDAVSEIRSLCDLTVVSGDDSLTLPMMSIGARGVISVAANLLPAEIKQLTLLASRSNLPEAAALHQTLFPLIRSLFQDGNPAGIKYAMKWLGRDSGELRLPLVEAGESVRIAIEQHLEKLIFERAA
jgi:4-hydroxy-tetrahydrodipicolinate synthase